MSPIAGIHQWGRSRGFTSEANMNGTVKFLQCYKGIWVHRAGWRRKDVFVRACALGLRGLVPATMVTA